MKSHSVVGLDASLLYSTSGSLNASVALTGFGDASDAFFLSRD